MARKTARQRRDQWTTQLAQVWLTFSDALRAAATISDVMKLVASAPRPDSPGRHFYSNLSFFALHSDFTVLGGADENEAVLYLGLMERLAKSGDLKPGVEERVRENLLRKVRTAAPWLPRI